MSGQSRSAECLGPAWPPGPPGTSLAATLSGAHDGSGTYPELPPSKEASFSDTVSLNCRKGSVKWVLLAVSTAGRKWTRLGGKPKPGLLPPGSPLSQNLPALTPGEGIRVGCWRHCWEPGSRGAGAGGFLAPHHAPL